MKIQFFTYLLILVYFIGLIKPIYPTVNYVFNYDYISKVLCINKDKPKLNCNGKCHVVKEIDDNKTKQEKELIILDFGLEKHIKTSENAFNFLIGLIKINAFNYKNNKCNSYITEVFHPPSF